MLKFQKLFKVFLLLLLLGSFSSLIAITATYLYLKPELPTMASLQDVQFQIPLRVYTRDEKLIAEFGEKRRTPIKYEQVPDTFVKAVLAAEDQNFFKHSGVDVKGLSRAVFRMIKNMGSIRGGGGSTITMQLTRALFLTKERKFKRKFKEIILAIQIENELSKEEILELYFNEIYLGKRAYGIQAAANVYYDKNIDELSIAQQAMIAGLPKAPAANNPVNDPEEALARRNWILGRMLELGFISQNQYNTAVSEAITAQDHGQANELDAPYIAEMIRKDLYKEYGDAIYTDGYKAYATILSKEQVAANEAVREGIHEYDERHGYRGIIEKESPDAVLELVSQFFEEEPPKIKSLKADRESEASEHIEYQTELLQARIIDSDFNLKKSFRDIPVSGKIIPALTLHINDDFGHGLFLMEDGSILRIEQEHLLWAAPFIDRNTVGELPEKISSVLQAGNWVYLRKTLKGDYRLAQLPEVQSALISVRPEDGAIISLVGGYDHSDSKFNRVTQGGRQAGSIFKPFIYTHALETGFTAATIVNDAPVVFEDKALESTWRPENSGGKFYGPTRIRQALYRSRNLVSIRVLRKMGVPDTIESLQRFGFQKSQLPANLSIALGSASLNPMEVATGFASFANGGYKISPYYLDELKDREGNTIFKANPKHICPQCLLSKLQEENSSAGDLDYAENSPLQTTGTSTPAVIPESTQEEPLIPEQAESIIEPRVVYIMDSMLADVIKRGTGRRALALGRNDIRGKTGTTNDQFDAWFSGYNSEVVTSVWVGFDSPETLGRGEFGATAALPIWLYFMDSALEGKEEKVMSQPDGMVTVKINSKTGEAAVPGDPDAIFEIFREEYAPKLKATQSHTPNETETLMPESIF